MWVEISFPFPFTPVDVWNWIVVIYNVAFVLVLIGVPIALFLLLIKQDKRQGVQTLGKIIALIGLYYAIGKIFGIPLLNWEDIKNYTQILFEDPIIT